jgi:Flp pilus assembly pilin Flp
VGGAGGARAGAHYCPRVALRAIRAAFAPIERARHQRGDFSGERARLAAGHPLRIRFKWPRRNVRFATAEGVMRIQSFNRSAGQGMTEYIIVVALIAIAAIGVYTAFGDIVRGQTSVAAAALSGADSADGRGLVGNAQGRANDEGREKTLENFEN